MNNYAKTIVLSAVAGFAITGVAPAIATTPGATSGPAELTQGMKAPTMDVGTDSVTKATVQYSNSIGSSDSFQVGATTNVGASANASSTFDYNVESNANFGIGTSTINQQIGTSSIEDIGPKTTSTTTSGNYWNRKKKTVIVGGVEKEVEAGTIMGSFNKTGLNSGATSTTNDVTVSGIGTDAQIKTAADASFKSDIKKAEGVTSDGAGSANGGASGSVGTSASASANNTSFVSSFAQAY
jgi:hypothetical protein